jgi:hypothetical protein
MLNSVVEIEKQDFRKLSSDKGMRTSPTYLQYRLTLDIEDYV